MQLGYIHSSKKQLSVVGSKFTQAHCLWLVQLGICGCALVLHT